MVMRDRLVEMIKNSLHRHIGKSCLLAENIADDILADGVIVPPCKVGQTVYYFSHRPFNLSVQANTVYEAIVVRIVTTRLGTQLVIQIRNEHGCTEVPDIRSWGKTVFATREEAVKALEGGGE
jgi:hypothetical protein